MKNYVIKTFYKFVLLPNYLLMKPLLLQMMKQYNVKGTIILAPEGINGSFCGEMQQTTDFADFLQQIPFFYDLQFHTTYDDLNPFDKYKVKFRQEIVSLGVSEINYLPEVATKTSVSPAAWNKLCNTEEVTLLDNRNEYEVKLGTFKGAINPHTINFRDFRQYIEKNLIHKKNNQIALFCTGGIRCEKTITYLHYLGFSNLYQLQGGILNYLTCANQLDSLWEGSCFVFDNRVALDKNLIPLSKELIDQEWKNNNRKKLHHD